MSVQRVTIELYFFFMLVVFSVSHFQSFIGQKQSYSYGHIECFCGITLHKWLTYENALKSQVGVDPIPNQILYDFD